jgi:hypothetical protein
LFLCLIWRNKEKLFFFLLYLSFIRYNKKIMSVIQNKKCGKCEKIVYPAEEIKCLDKVSCFFYCLLFFILLYHLDIRQKGKSRMRSSYSWRVFFFTESSCMITFTCLILFELTFVFNMINWFNSSFGIKAV